MTHADMTALHPGRKSYGSKASHTCSVLLLSVYSVFVLQASDIQTSDAIPPPRTGKPQKTVRKTQTVFLQT
jgi:hypothetical protein